MNFLLAQLWQSISYFLQDVLAALRYLTLLLLENIHQIYLQIQQIIYLGEHVAAEGSRVLLRSIIWDIGFYCQVLLTCYAVPIVYMLHILLQLLEYCDLPNLKQAEFLLRYWIKVGYHLAHIELPTWLVVTICIYTPIERLALICSLSVGKVFLISVVSAISSKYNI